MATDAAINTFSHEQVIITCSVAASNSYGLDPAVLLAVAKNEGGKPSTISKNSNGSDDLGYMQFNTNYLKTLEKYGINKDHVTSNNCYPFFLAAWRIKRHIKYDSGDFWTKVANYHSRTEKFNSKYKLRLIENYGYWKSKLTTTASHQLVKSTQGYTPRKVLIK